MLYSLYSPSFICSLPQYFEVKLQSIKTLNNKIPLYRVARLRKRSLFTRTNKLRLRYIAGSVAIASLMITGLLGSASTSIAFAPANTEIVQDINFKTYRALEFPQSYINDYPMSISSNSVGMHDESNKIITIKSGSTIAEALQEQGISGAEAYRIVKAISDNYDPRLVKAGQDISITTEINNGIIELSSLNMKLSQIKEINITREGNNDFTSILDEKETHLQIKAGKTFITTSLSGSAVRDGIPSSVISQIMKIYSHNIDFQRDIRKGDKLEILYETYETENGDFVKNGNIIFANLMVSGKDNSVYRYKSKDGAVDFYRNSGENLKRTLMQTPIDGARISSRFGMRKHPVLGYNKMHKGIDFAVSRGTPIYAAGTGVIEKAGRHGGYGNYVKIRHNNSLKTAYAHMKKFAKGIKSGTRVTQGQLIGYVGTTGRSTGPHLHFEVLKNGAQVNPKSIKSTSNNKLSGNNLTEFKQEISTIKQQYAALIGRIKLAKNSLHK